jgi:hypothetical protein
LAQIADFVKKYIIKLEKKILFIHYSNMKLSPLDIKKKKIIQKIRTLLNDYPSLHPLAHKVFISANYRVLYDLHLNLLTVDGLAHKRGDGITKGSLPMNLPQARRGGLTVNFEDEINQNRLESATEALERAKRLAEKRRIVEQEQKTKEDKKKKELLKKRQSQEKNNPLTELVMDII